MNVMVSSSSFVYSMLFVFVFVLNTVLSLQIGRINNAIFEALTFGETFFNLTYDGCTCAALRVSAVGWNYFPSNGTCQTIQNYSSNDIGLQRIADGKFVFRYLPSYSSSEETTSKTINSTTSTQTSASTASVNTRNVSCENLRWHSTYVVVAGTVGSSGIASNLLNKPNGLALDPTTSALFIADANKNRIQRWLPFASNGTTVAGDPLGSNGVSNNLLDTATDVSWVINSASLYIADTSNNRIMRVVPSNTTSNATRIAGNITGGTLLYQLNKPAGLVVDQAETYLYVADTENHRIVRWLLNSNATTGEVIVGVTGSAGHSNDTLQKPNAVKLNADNSALYIADTENNRIQMHIFSSNTTRTVAGNSDGSGDSTSTGLKKPQAIAIDSLQNLYVADTENNRIQFFCANSSNATTILDSFSWSKPAGIAVDSLFNLYVSNTEQNYVLKFTLLT